MKDTRSQILLSLVCLLLATAIMIRFRSGQDPNETLSQATDGQAAYAGQLYDSNAALREQADQLAGQVARYDEAASTDKVHLESVQKDLQDMRMANGQVEATGPGVTVAVQGQPTVFELQDLVNEVRNASAEAIAVNGVRVVARSAIVADAQGRLTVDRQVISSPYYLEAIGEPDTLFHALERKGGLIALLVAGSPGLDIHVTEHPTADRAGWLRLPRTAAGFDWNYGQPVPAP